MTTASQGSTTSTIRAVPEADRDRAIGTLVTAFSDDPVVRWVYPEPQQYLAHFRRFIELYAGKAFERGTAYHADGFVGSALWLKPEALPDEEAVMEHLLESVSPGEQERVFAVFEELDRHHPEEPVWYLPFIGVDPAHQGQGYGSALLRHALVRCDAEHLPAYLESSNERNVPLYERHGFEVVTRVEVEGAPPFWPMYRAAR